jgi:hypothetical protein
MTETRLLCAQDLSLVIKPLPYFLNLAFGLAEFINIQARVSSTLPAVFLKCFMSHGPRALIIVVSGDPCHITSKCCFKGSQTGFIASKSCRQVPLQEMIL